MPRFQPQTCRRPLVLSIAILTATAPALSQPVDPAGVAAPSGRGPVAVDCYARSELWQGDARTPVRLLFTRVLYNEAASGAMRSDLTSQWNKFIGPLLIEGGAQPGQNRIVYCQYADAASNTEIARWPASAAPPEEVQWPGRSIAWQAGNVMAPVQGASASMAPAATPGALPIPAASPTPAPIGAAPAALAAPSPAAPPLVQIGSATPSQSQEAGAIYGEILRRDQQFNREEQARNDTYRQQVEAYQKELAAAQAAQRAFMEQRAAYEAQRAAYEAKVGKDK